MFVVFEGIDDTGKSTLINKIKPHLLRHDLEDDDYKISTLESFNDKIRLDKLVHEYPATTISKALLASGIRASKYDAIKFKRIHGVLLMDRYKYSNYAYSGGVCDIEFIKEIDKYAPIPDLVFLFTRPCALDSELEIQHRYLDLVDKKRNPYKEEQTEFIHIRIDDPKDDQCWWDIQKRLIRTLKKRIDHDIRACCMGRI